MLLDSLVISRDPRGFYYSTRGFTVFIHCWLLELVSFYSSQYIFVYIFSDKVSKKSALNRIHTSNHPSNLCEPQ